MQKIISTYDYKEEQIYAPNEIEKVLLMTLPKDLNFNYIVRNQDGQLVLFEKEPYLGYNMYRANEGQVRRFLYNDQFQFIQWGDKPHLIQSIINSKSVNSGVIEQPFIPKYGEEYYTTTVKKRNESGAEYATSHKAINTLTKYDLFNLMFGLCFKTQEGAMANAQRNKEVFQSVKELYE